MASNEQTNSNNLSEFSPLVRHWGTTANRPSTNLVTGQVYADTTLKQWFSYNGSTWDPYGTGSGASFPASPATYQRYFRTDRGLEYYYDGTRWLTTQIWFVPIEYKPSATITTNSLTATSNGVMQGVHPDASSDLYVTTIVTNLFATGAHSGTNYWTINYKTRDNALTVTHTYSGDTKLATTASRNFPVTVAVNAVVTRADFYDAVADFVMTGTPGNVFFEPAVMNCRLVG
jgi:hypothetical protein